jgi:biopolymer transport protein ExbD
MDPNRFRSLLAVPLASLFLILVLCLFAVQRPPSVGMNLPLPRVRIDPISNCNFLSDRNIVVHLRKDGSIWINETQESPDELGHILTKIYENRDEKVIYMLSDPDISYGEFANIYNKVASSTNDLYIVLSTRQLNKEFQKCPSGVYCGLDWPDHTYQPCVWINIHPTLIPRQTRR